MRTSGGLWWAGLTALACASGRGALQPARRAGEALPACVEARALQARAVAHREQGRLLRATLLDERAHALCAAEVKLQSEQGRPGLDGVLAWIAATDPLLALSPERLPDAAQARRLDEATLDLVRGSRAPLTLAPLDAQRAPTREHEGWLVRDGALARVGEWFERYTVPVSATNAALAPAVLGPFSDRVVLHNRAGLDGHDLSVFLDLADGRMLAELTAASGYAADALALDARHVLIPVEEPPAPCDGADRSSLGQGHDVVELWQTQPLARLARFTPPAPGSLLVPEIVRAPALPAAPPGPPRDHRVREGYGMYAPVRLEAHRGAPPTPAAADRVHRIDDLGHGLVAIDWGGALSVVDWRAGRELAALPHVEQSSGPSAASSAGGRRVAFTWGPEWIGLYDRDTGKSRVMTAPGFHDANVGRFSPDGRWLVTGGDYDFGHLWDARDGRLVRTLPSPFRWQLIAEDQGMLSARSFLRGGLEVLLGTLVGGSLRRYDVASGRELPIPFDVAASPERITDHVERADGSTVFIDSNGCLAGELGADGTPISHPCEGGFGDLIGTTPDGEWIVRAGNAAAGGTNYALGQVEVVSARSGAVVRRWLDSASFATSLSQDGRFVLGAMGSVRALSDGRVLWPDRSGVGGGLPRLEGSRFRFDGGTWFDLGQAELGCDPETDPRDGELTSERQAQLARVAARQRVETGIFAAECDAGRGRTLFTEGASVIAERAGCEPLLAIDGDGDEVLLGAARGLLVWEPRLRRERGLMGSDLAGVSPEGAAFGPQDSLALVARRDGGYGPLALFLIDARGEQILWSEELAGPPRGLRFSAAGGRSTLRAVVVSRLIGWDARSGQRIESWDEVEAYEQLAGGRALALLRPEQLELVSTAPPSRLLTLIARDGWAGALARSSDGRIELLGDRPAIARGLRCRSGHRVLPVSACVERYEWPGLLEETLARLLPLG